ncbi:type II toxin-antitoxin system RelE/ParE family toxin [Candidatus Woesearchaeota archaeon]|nr:type II toxin-antitoxin system RelE/ParE family toxin [Candidatus Woesearchaeota archaeon]
MVYEIQFTERAEKDLLKLDHIIQQRILAALERIRIRPEAYLTKLVGDAAYKLRVGDYRVLMEFHRGKLILLVLKLWHRRNIYRGL